MALTSRAKVKSVLGIPTGVTRQDDLIDTLVSVANDLVLNEIDLPSESVATYSEKIDVGYTGQREVQVRYRPLVSVVALTIGGSALVESDDDFYFTDAGSIRLISDGAYMVAARQTVEVTYTAGFSATPAELSHAATLIAAQSFNQGGHSGFRSEKTGSYSYTVNDAMIPPIAQRILNKYRRVFANGAY